MKFEPAGIGFRVGLLLSVHRWWPEMDGGLYESSRAVNMVDGLPRAPSEDISRSCRQILVKSCQIQDKCM